MLSQERPIYIASRGSALALAQARAVLSQCQGAFPELVFQIKIFKTTGDQMQTLALAQPNQQLAKGLFTKELEVALLNGEADLAVHSLKDLPTELPAGLKLAAVSERADVRDLLIFRSRSVEGRRGLFPGAGLNDFPAGATLGTSSTRRQAQLLSLRPDLRVVPIRGNVGTRLQKLAEQGELDGLVLAAAGFARLKFVVEPDGAIRGEGVPEGLAGVILEPDEMLPCVGQAALGYETRAEDPRMEMICGRLNHPGTQACVTAERAFLRAMGGGCLSPVAAYAEMEGAELRLRALSFRNERIRTGELRAPLEQAEELGREMARTVGN
jgi:hydroxymethylbilane synthase